MLIFRQTVYVFFASLIGISVGAMVIAEVVPIGEDYILEGTYFRQIWESIFPYFDNSLMMLQGAAVMSIVISIVFAVYRVSRFRNDDSVVTTNTQMKW